MPTTKIRTQVKYQKISSDDGYIDAQVGGSKEIKNERKNMKKLLQEHYMTYIFLLCPI